MRTFDREELIAELQRLRPEFEREGVAHMALFGSRARRDNRPDSDIDLVIEVSDQASGSFSFLDLIGIAHIIEDRVGLEANLVMRRSLNHNLSWTVGRDQVSVF